MESCRERIRYVEYLVEYSGRFKLLRRRSNRIRRHRRRVSFDLGEDRTRERFQRVEDDHRVERWEVGQVSKEF